MMVPWSRLPEIRKTIPEYYDNLFYHTPWTKALLQFIFDPNLTGSSRIGRPDHEEKTPEKMTTVETGQIIDATRDAIQTTPS